jgi:hypothetical protein
VVLGVKDEYKLSSILPRLDSAGIPYRTFVEPDIGDQLTAVATAPISGERRDFFKNFQLLKGTA